MEENKKDMNVGGERKRSEDFKELCDAPSLTTGKIRKIKEEPNKD